MHNLKRILVYVRPWETRLFAQTAELLAESLQIEEVVYVTFFDQVVEQLRSSGRKVVYLPPVLNSRDVSVRDAETLQSLDLQLFKRFGTNLYLLAQMERYLPSNAKLAEQFIATHALVLDELVPKHTLSFSSMYDHFAYMLGGLLALLRGGVHFAFVPCGLPPNRMLALRTPWEAWEKAEMEDVDALWKACVKALEEPARLRLEYMRDIRVPLRQRAASLLNRHRMYRSCLCDRAAGSYFPVLGTNVWKHLFWAAPLYHGIQRWLPAHEPAYDCISAQELEELNGRCVYMPLHLEPEATILTYSPWIRDQVEACRVVAQNLPLGWLLLVKENPKMVGQRKGDFYTRLSRIPGVRLLSPSIESRELILRSAATVSIAGTASAEAVLLGKLGFCLGTPPFSMMLTGASCGASQAAQNFFHLLLSQPSCPRAGWESWLRCTFEASGTAIIRDGVFEVDPSSTNARRYHDFVLSALRFDRNSPAPEKSAATSA